MAKDVCRPWTSNPAQTFIPHLHCHNESGSSSFKELKDPSACMQTSGLASSLGLRRLLEAGSCGIQYEAMSTVNSSVSQTEALEAVDLAEALDSLGNSSKALTEYLLHFSEAPAKDQAAKMYACHGCIPRVLCRRLRDYPCCI